VTPDGTTIVYRDDDTKSFDIGLASMTGARTSQTLLHTKFNEVNADLSPDGRWIVYQSDESGRDEIYVRPFPRVDDGWSQVSTAGGTAPAWGRTGREIFYLEAGRRMMAVTIQLQPTFASQPPQFLFERPDDGPGGVGRYFDVSRDGKRFLMLKPITATAGDGQRIVVVQNWTEELKRLVATK
jgi:serine/threonine-protein kinase